MAELREKLIAGVKRAREPLANEDVIEHPDTHEPVVTSHDMGTTNFCYFIGEPNQDESIKEHPDWFALVLKFIRWIKASLKGETVPQYDESIMKLLLKEPLIAHNRVVRVHIEQQVAVENPVMYAISSGVTMLYLVRKEDQVSRYPEAVYTVNAHLKFSYFGIKCPEGYGKKPFRKKLACLIVLFLLEHWVKTGRLHKKWLNLYNENKSKQDDYADCFLQCYAEECKLANVFPTWAALQELWGYLVKDKIFASDGKCPLELTAEMQKKYDSYIKRLDKIKDKKEKEDAKAKELEEKNKTKKKTSSQTTLPVSKKQKSSSTPPTPAPAASSSVMTTRVSITVDEIECTPPVPPPVVVQKRSSSKTTISKPPPMSKKSRRVALELESVPAEKGSGPTNQQRDLQALLKGAKEKAKQEREKKRQRARRGDSDEDDDDDFEDPRDKSYQEEQEAEDDDADLQAAIKASMEQTEGDSLFYDDEDDFEKPKKKKAKRKKSSEKEEHFLINKERLALEKRERELAASTPLVIDLLSDEESVEHEEQEPPQVQEPEEEEDEFSRLAREAVQTRTVI